MNDKSSLALFDAISPVVWRLPRMLAYACQPGYPHERVPEALVTAWLNHVRAEGIASIICLLSGRELATGYGDHRVGLLRRYREGGFQVAHISHALVPRITLPLASSFLSIWSCGKRYMACCSCTGKHIHNPLPL